MDRAMPERIDIEALRAVVERMTPGPWEDDVDSIGGTESCPNGAPRYRMVVGLERGRGWESCDSLALSDADRNGIISIRNAIGPLLDELTELRTALPRISRERVDALNTCNAWREAIESCCFGAIPSPRAAKSAIEELKTRLDDATKRARRLGDDAAESRAWHQTAIELKKRLVAAEDELAKMRGPALAYVSNGEAGDGQHVCSSCGEERDQPHTWEECAKRLAEMHEKADASYWGAIRERDETIARAERAERLCIAVADDGDNAETMAEWDVWPKDWREQVDAMRARLGGKR